MYPVVSWNRRAAALELYVESLSKTSCISADILSEINFFFFLEHERSDEGEKGAYTTARPGEARQLVSKVLLLVVARSSIQAKASHVSCRSGEYSWPFGRYGRGSVRAKASHGSCRSGEYFSTQMSTNIWDPPW